MAWHDWDGITNDPKAITRLTLGPIPNQEDRTKKHWFILEPTARMKYNPLTSLVNKSLCQFF
jgi:hypothetical protein